LYFIITALTLIAKHLDGGAEVTGIGVVAGVDATVSAALDIPPLV
jgi:hypothetical protein